jgi:hypothetical protein
MKKNTIAIMTLVILGLTVQATAQQNQYTSVADRMKQERYDRIHPDPTGDAQVKPNSPYQEIMNGVYSGSNTKGYKVDKDGNDVPLDE